MDKLERRVFTHISLNELPSTALEAAVGVSGNVIYFPRISLDTGNNNVDFANQYQVISQFYYTARIIGMDDVLLDYGYVSYGYNTNSAQPNKNYLTLCFRSVYRNSDHGYTTTPGIFGTTNTSSGAATFAPFANLFGIDASFLYYTNGDTIYYSKIYLNSNFVVSNVINSDAAPAPFYIDTE